MPDIDGFLRAVEEKVQGVVVRRASEVARSGNLPEILGVIDGLVARGGKRVRPRFVLLGWAACGGGEPSDALVSLAAGLELAHVAALVHDDVADGSATRRGGPAVHVEEMNRHVAAGWSGEPRRHGEGAAVLAGDVAMAISDELVNAARPETLAHWREMKTAVALGQVLDVAATASRVWTRETAAEIIRLKTSEYTVIRPLLMGATEHDPVRAAEISAALTEYGSRVGEAFQLHDDVLGTFGDPTTTGKPVNDDLREGKPTLMLALAWEAADPEQRSVLSRVGDPALSDDDAAAVRNVLVATGALAAVQDRVDRATSDAVGLLEASHIPVTTVATLVEVSRELTSRSS